MRSLHQVTTALALSVTLTAVPQVADAQSCEPYIFLLFDTTVSMFRDVDGVTPPLWDDDPTSKLWIAKSAVSSFLEHEAEVHFGFATFPDLDRLRIIEKREEPGLGSYIIPKDFVNDGGNSEEYCGWEGNDDDELDAYRPATRDNFNNRYLTDRRPGRPPVGDVLPFDWLDDNAQNIRERLSPNLQFGETEPDFGIAPYFEDTPTENRDYLLSRERGKPLIAEGLTPLAIVLRDFREWYEFWRSSLKGRDPDIDCRGIYVLLLTDGFDICSAEDEAAIAAEELLFELGIGTYVIGFAVDNPNLDDIAEAGGTDLAYTAGSESELVEALQAVIDDIRAP